VIELGYDEIKTEVLEREESIRSQNPSSVAQEIWGILLAYNLVRLEMERVADEAGVAPTRISFIAALHLVCDEWLWCAVASPGNIPKHLRNLRAKLTRLILPPRRDRSYRIRSMSTVADGREPECYLLWRCSSISPSATRRNTLAARRC